MDTIEDVLKVGDLEVAESAYTASFAGRDLHLSGSQVELLAYLIKNRARVTGRDEIADLLGLKQPRSVDVLLTGIRHRIGRNFVRTVRRRGWSIDPSALEA